MTAEIRAFTIFWEPGTDPYWDSDMHPWEVRALLDRSLEMIEEMIEADSEAEP